MSIYFYIYYKFFVMPFYIEGTVQINQCFCRKNKTNGIHLQCPHVKKFGDFCGRHKNPMRWRHRIDEPLGNTNNNSGNTTNNLSTSLVDQPLSTALVDQPLSTSLADETQPLPPQKVLINLKHFREDYNLNRFNIISMKYTCRKYKLPTSSYKEYMIDTLTNFFCNIDEYESKYMKEVKLIQRNIRYFHKNKNVILRGPGLNNREKCNNQEDFLTFEPINNIPNSKFFSYKDVDNFIYAFEFNSFKKLIENKMNNPYNRNQIPKHAIKNLNRLIKIQKKEEDTNTLHLTSKQKMVHMVLKICQEIERHGVYAGGIQIDWFMDLDKDKLKFFYKTLEDIWNYRANLNNTQKSRIAPFQNMFYYSVSRYYKIISINKMRNILFEEIEKLIFSADEDGDRAMGSYYTLISLVEVNPTVASLMPWLVQI